VTLSPSGKLLASPDTIAELRRLCREDAASLQPEPPERPASAQLDDAGIEGVLASLLAEVHQAAMQSFRLAREHSYAGSEVAIYDACVGHGARLARAAAELAIVISRHKGKSQRLILEHFVHRGV
jgi:hypothetical protein